MPTSFYFLLGETNPHVFYTAEHFWDVNHVWIPFDIFMSFLRCAAQNWTPATAKKGMIISYVMSSLYIPL